MTLSSPQAPRVVPSTSAAPAQSLNGPPTGASQDPGRIREMFAGISPSYDRLNFLLSAGRDKRWRERLARTLIDGLDPCRHILDIATGTGDLADAIAKEAASSQPDIPRGGAAARVTGLDFTRQMLVRARDKFGREHHAWFEGDAMRLPFASGRFDGVSIAFGLRNVEDRPAALREMARVLRPAGRVAILEFFEPRNPIMRRLYDLYSFTIMPRLGRLISGSDAYLYLPRSIRHFWTPERLGDEMRRAGLTRVTARPIMAGIVWIHIGEATDSSTCGENIDND